MTLQYLALHFITDITYRLPYHMPYSIFMKYVIINIRTINVCTTVRIVFLFKLHEQLEYINIYKLYKPYKQRVSHPEAIRSLSPRM